jgi:hypothetical protein
MTRSQTTKQEHSKRRDVVTRDFLAAHALAGLVQAHGVNASTFADEIAKDAYDIADAMLKERVK